MSIINKLKAVADIIAPPVGYKTLFIRSDTGAPALMDSDGNVENLVLGGDAAGVTYTPLDVLDWTDSVDPGNVAEALDDLALRTRSLENSPGGVSDAADVTYTPTTAADWDGDADPGDAQEAFDQLAERVTNLEEAPAGSGDVSAAANIADNRLVRGDGGVKGIQESGITVDDSNNVTGVAALSATTIELGHASDTTIARSGAGDISIEGNAVYRASGTDVPVADGGTGRSSHTAYAVICGGTTGTGAQQSIAGVGTAGQVLTSNGAGALPTFQTATGKMVQVVNTQTGAVATGTTILPVDDTIPQNTEGDEYMTLAITPTSATNKLRIEVVIALASATSARALAAALFQDSTASALAAAQAWAPTANGGVMLSFSHYMTAGTTSATTFKVRAGPNLAATVTFNGGAGSRTFGGVNASSITITEIAP